MSGRYGRTTNRAVDPGSLGERREKYSPPRGASGSIRGGSRTISVDDNVRSDGQRERAPTFNVTVQAPYSEPHPGHNKDNKPGHRKDPDHNKDKHSGHNKDKHPDHNKDNKDNKDGRKNPDHNKDKLHDHGHHKDTKSVGEVHTDATYLRLSADCVNHLNVKITSMSTPASSEFKDLAMSSMVRQAQQIHKWQYGDDPSLKNNVSVKMMPISDDVEPVTVPKTVGAGAIAISTSASIARTVAMQDATDKMTEEGKTAFTGISTKLKLINIVLGTQNYTTEPAFVTMKIRSDVFKDLGEKARGRMNVKTAGDVPITEIIIKPPSCISFIRHFMPVVVPSHIVKGSKLTWVSALEDITLKDDHMNDVSPDHQKEYLKLLNDLVTTYNNMNKTYHIPPKILGAVPNPEVAQAEGGGFAAPSSAFAHQNAVKCGVGGNGDIGEGGSTDGPDIGDDHSERGVGAHGSAEVRHVMHDPLYLPDHLHGSTSQFSGTPGERAHKAGSRAAEIIAMQRARVIYLKGAVTGLLEKVYKQGDGVTEHDVTHFGFKKVITVNAFVSIVISQVAIIGVCTWGKSSCVSNLLEINQHRQLKEWLDTYATGFVKLAEGQYAVGHNNHLTEEEHTVHVATALWLIDKGISDTDVVSGVFRTAHGDEHHFNARTYMKNAQSLDYLVQEVQNDPLAEVKKQAVSCHRSCMEMSVTNKLLHLLVNHVSYTTGVFTANTSSSLQDTIVALNFSLMQNHLFANQGIVHSNRDTTMPTDLVKLNLFKVYHVKVDDRFFLEQGTTGVGILRHIQEMCSYYEMRSLLHRLGVGIISKADNGNIL
ncbi:hypothetical protein T484DRAFT_1754560 [Baffinella frigidus]|nr:hypothetical protein T484DRAFT_1754560 [Cryptophyta sp. CCMP2293]